MFSFSVCPRGFSGVSFLWLSCCKQSLESFFEILNPEDLMFYAVAAAHFWDVVCMLSVNALWVLSNSFIFIFSCCPFSFEIAVEYLSSLLLAKRQNLLVVKYDKEDRKLYRTCMKLKKKHKRLLCNNRSIDNDND